MGLVLSRKEAALFTSYHGGVGVEITRMGQLWGIGSSFEATHRLQRSTRSVTTR